MNILNIILKQKRELLGLLFCLIVSNQAFAYDVEVVSVSNNNYTISNITRNTTVEVEFEGIEIPTIYQNRVFKDAGDSLTFTWWYTGVIEPIKYVVAENMAWLQSDNKTLVKVLAIMYQ